MHRIILIVTIFVSLLYSTDYYAGDSLVRSGVQAFYNYEFDEAVDILTDARKKFPDHPGVHLIWVAALWVRSQAYDTVVEANLILETDLALIQPIYKNLVKSNPYDPNYLLYQGSALGLSARVTLGQKKWFRTLYRAYKGFSIIDDVAEKYPEVIDARLPIGIIEYYAGMSNVLLKWSIQLYGLNSSRESGLEEITKAADQGDWAWIEAKGILSFLYLWVENEPIHAFKYSRDLVDQFPKNYYFNLLLLESTIRTEKYDESSRIIGRLNSLSPTLTERQKEWYIPYLNYEKALLSFHLEQYDNVLLSVNKTISSYSAELDIILGNAYLLQGKAYDKLDQRLKAKSSYEACINLNNFSSSMNEAKQYYETPFYQ